MNEQIIDKYNLETANVRHLAMIEKINKHTILHKEYQDFGNIKDRKEIGVIISSDLHLENNRNPK